MLDRAGLGESGETKEEDGALRLPMEGACCAWSAPDVGGIARLGKNEIARLGRNEVVPCATRSSRSWAQSNMVEFRLRGWWWAAIVGAMALTSLGSVRALAQGRAEHVQPVVALVDIPSVLENALATQSIREQIARYRSELEAEELRYSNGFREKELEMERQKGAWTAKIMAERRRAYEEEVLTARDFLQNRYRAVGSAEKRANEQVEGVMTEVIREIAGERGYNLVLAGHSVVMMHPAMDISDDVLGELNRRLSAVTVTLEP